MAGWNDLPFEIKHIVLEHCIWDALSKAHQRQNCDVDFQVMSFVDLFNFTVADPGARGKVIKMAVDVQRVCQRTMSLFQTQHPDLRDLKIVGTAIITSWTTRLEHGSVPISRKELEKAKHLSKLLTRVWDWCMDGWLEAGMIDKAGRGQLPDDAMEDTDNGEWISDESDEEEVSKDEKEARSRDGRTIGQYKRCVSRRNRWTSKRC